MAVLQGEFCAVNIEVAFRAEPNGRYIEVAVLQRAGIARVYCTQTAKNKLAMAGQMGRLVTHMDKLERSTGYTSYIYTSFLFIFNSF